MDIFKSRRETLLEKMSPASVAIIFGHNIQHKNADTEHLFRQHSDILYLTGFKEPDCCLALCKSYEGETRTILFLPEKNLQEEIWNGKRLGVEHAPSVLGVDEAFSINLLGSELAGILSGHDVLYYSFAKNMKNDIKILRAIEEAREGARRGASAPEVFEDASIVLHEMRLFKDDQEIELMRKAASISATGHNYLMQTVRADMYEYQLEGSFVNHCMQQGCRGLAYPAIVAAGDNACILHYTDNQSKIDDGQLVLVDAGGEYQGYAADITRTFPANGKFTEPQKQIYELVLDAQLEGISNVKPGSPVDLVQKSILTVLTRGLVKLGLLSGDVEKLIENKAYMRFYMHGSGHWLGLDVHDAGRYKLAGKWRNFEPGMVITVEPGLYIPSDDDIPEQYRGIGVRIEDDILVTKDGHDNLSIEAAKSISDIEQLMAQSNE